MSTYRKIPLTVNIESGRLVDPDDGAQLGSSFLPSIYYGEKLVLCISFVDSSLNPSPFNAGDLFELSLDSNFTHGTDPLMAYSDDTKVDIEGDWAEISRANGKISIRVDALTAGFAQKLGSSEQIDAWLEIKRYIQGDSSPSVLLLNKCITKNVVHLDEDTPAVNDPLYYTKTESDALYLHDAPDDGKQYCRKDADWAEIAVTGIGDVVGPASSTDGNFPAFNGTSGKTLKDSGYAASDFAEANHNHASVYEPANANIQTHISSVANPHSVTKTQVGLANVSNDAQLKIASNLSDLASAATARTNLGLGDSATKNVGTGSGTVAAGNDARFGNATTLQSRAFASTAPTDGQGIVWDATGSTWKPGTVSGGGSMVYPGAGIPVSTGSAWDTSKTTPSGDLVGTSDSQALTNKSVNGVTPTAQSTGFTLAGGTTSKTLTVSGDATISQTPPVFNEFDNASFGIWQRGTTSAAISTTRTLLADRFAVTTGAGTLTTVARSTSVPSGGRSQYSLELTGAEGVSTVDIDQRIEGRRAARLKTTVTFSAYIYNNSGAAFTPTLFVSTPSALDNWTTSTVRNNGGSGDALQECADTAWTRVTWTADISGYTDIGYGLEFKLRIPSGSMVASDVVNIAQVKLEASSVATAFIPTPYTDDLLRCQRYAYQVATNATVWDRLCLGINTSTTAAFLQVNLAIPMISVPTVSISDASHFKLLVGGSTFTITGLSIHAYSGRNPIFIDATGATGMTAGAVCNLYINNSATASLLFSTGF